MATTTNAQHASAAFNGEHFSSLITHAGILLGLTNTEIKNKYRDFPVTLSTLYEDGEETDAVEVLFEEENGLLTCMFNTKDKRCDYVIISFNEPVNPDDCIGYLNNHYPYDFLNQSWNLPNGRACVKHSVEGICVGIHRLF